MASFEAAVEIARAHRDVFGFLMDPRNNLRWQSGLVATGCCGESPVGVGSRFWEVRTVLGRRVESSFEVVAFEPPLTATIRCTTGPFPLEATYRVRAIPGGSHVTASGTIADHAVPRVAGRLLAQAVRREVHRDLAKLQAVLEHPSAARHPAPALVAAPAIG